MIMKSETWKKLRNIFTNSIDIVDIIKTYIFLMIIGRIGECRLIIRVLVRSPPSRPLGL